MQRSSFCFLAALALVSCFVASSARAGAPLQRFSSRDPYYIYYGSWNASLLSTVQANGYKLVIAEPRVMTRAQVADLQNGADNVLDTADDIRVVGYISFGEDNRLGIYQTDANGQYVYVDGHRVIKTIAGGTGPRVDPRGASPAAGTLAATLNPDGTASLGNASPGGTGYASFYLDNPPYDGKPEFNGEFAGAYVNAGDPVYAGITIDGAFTDWPITARVWEDPSGDQGSAPLDLKAVWIANDRDYVYFRVDTWNTHDFHAFGNNLYLDADRSVATGFEPFGAGLVGSELLMQGDGLYSQKLGGWNDGYAASVAIAPYATSTTSWEWKIPRSLAHPASAGGGSVFDDTGFKYLVTSGSTVNDETSAVLTYTFAPPSVSATITIDGNGADWPAIAKVYDDATGDNAGAPSDVKAVWLANDADYIYLRIDTWNSHDYAAFYNNTYLDTDLSAATGFHPHGLAFGSELLLQNTGAYGEKLGGWNEGAATSPSAKTVTMAPTGGSATTWEWRIPRDLVHPSGGGAVFSGAFNVLVTSDNAGAAELAPDNPAGQVIRYVPAP
ncbi:MAG: hypothetical protein WC661_19060 [Opitutaceae bacterium]|jgi:hypothetical protein